jgi:hypothetical protein
VWRLPSVRGDAQHRPTSSASIAAADGDSFLTAPGVIRANV